jgi:hypothetical protein
VAFSAWSVDVGQFPKRLYTGFDCKLLEGHTAAFLRENKVIVRGSPSGHQNQNGLVERAWQTITGMGRAFITDMQMPHQYWYWALRQAVQVHNYTPCTVEGISTTPHELVYGVKPDLRVLFRMFSTGFFRHSSDGTHHHSGIAESKSMQCITIGRCWKSDGMLFYCPYTKRIYSSSVYKLDEHRNTPNLFNLRYDGGIFIGLYNPSSTTSTTEPYPEGTSVSLPLESGITMRGIVISVPISQPNNQLPISDEDAPPYTIRLVDGSIHKVSPDFMDVIHVSESHNNHGFTFPSWLGHSQKVMFLHNGTYLKGHMEWDLDNSTWRFSQCCHNGVEIFGATLPDFFQSFQRYIDDGTLVPVWHGGINFQIAGRASHVSATTLSCHIPPGSLSKALYSRNPDRQIWLESYKEEYDGLISHGTFDVIDESEYLQLCRSHQIKAIPSMCTFTIKKNKWCSYSCQKSYRRLRKLRSSSMD